ncbi:Ribosomal RNA small subunit methyltransferase C [Zhongshania aliphaticivorans]|uniref:Ribosomal RNA small subunit methyltransferase C n=1 Tax=Zhongshania aliphaticivorans TaxID=1470434 RepID=A0A5S9P5W0_9GAMM|nr:methyltransferase [Zhongshania aliphaticivorans]CAA0091511.1 Ribosomal RNA small subunit methyltransferase C [Zhongshania aliphaticivorans]CAA0098871.1 Ribosomal RNA small subunit methyltransferase C [Zhongshania aliphaticivorans]
MAKPRQGTLKNADGLGSDSALAALYSQFSSLGSQVWWFADEHIADMSLPFADNAWQCFTNRCDIAKQLQDTGYQVLLGDFDIPLEMPSPQTICYRVSKEKAVVHHILNQALARLPLGGCLLLSGHKNDGLHSYAKKAAALIGTQAEIKKQDGGAYLAKIIKQSSPQERLNDSDYPRIREIAQTPQLFSKPGVFGWQKLDRGSELLISQLHSYLAKVERLPTRVADIGCGYGYLSVMAAQILPDAEWLLTDNNAAAILAAQKNCSVHHLKAEIVLADCAAGLQGPVDLVLCNPPFHQGFAVAGSLTDRFLAAAHRLLTKQGCALFVVNQFIPLERKALGLFGASQVLLEQDGFKVVSLQKD